MGGFVKYLKQFLIIIAICFAGEVLHALLPLPVPASIYGLVLMFSCLQFKIFPLSAVEETSDFLLGIMALFFVPSTVGLVTAGALMKAAGLQFIAVGVISTFIVFGVTGLTTQGIIRIFKKKNAPTDSSSTENLSE